MRSDFFVGQPMFIGWKAEEPPPSAPVITSSLARSATVGRSFSYTITAKGRPAPTFNATGLPAGLTFSGNRISGTPTTAATSGHSITLTATNSEGTDTKTLVLTIAEAAGPGPGPGPGGSGVPWTVTYDFYPTTTNFATGTDIPLTDFVGWQAAYNADMTNDLYNAPTPAAMKVRLFSTRAPAAEVEVAFDNWGPYTQVVNTLHEWGYIAASHSIRINGTTSNTAVPFQLRLEHTP